MEKFMSHHTEIGANAAPAHLDVAHRRVFLSVRLIVLVLNPVLDVDGVGAQDDAYKGEDDAVVEEVGHG